MVARDIGTIPDRTDVRSAWDMMKAREQNHRQNEVSRVFSASRAWRAYSGWKDHR